MGPRDVLEADGCALQIEAMPLLDTTTLQPDAALDFPSTVAFRRRDS
jgi:hypothetical protein